MPALTRPPRSRGALRVRGVLWLAFLALLLRAVVPAGYMPTPARCTTAGSRSPSARRQAIFPRCGWRCPPMTRAARVPAPTPTPIPARNAPSGCWRTLRPLPPRTPRRWHCPAAGPRPRAGPARAARAAGPRAAPGLARPASPGLTPPFRAAPPRLREPSSNEVFMHSPSPRALLGAPPRPTVTGAGCCRPWPCCPWPAAAPKPPRSTAWTCPACPPATSN